MLHRLIKALLITKSIVVKFLFLFLISVLFIYFLLYCIVLYCILYCINIKNKKIKNKNKKSIVNAHNLLLIHCHSVKGSYVLPVVGYRDSCMSDRSL